MIAQQRKYHTSLGKYIFGNNDASFCDDVNDFIKKSRIAQNGKCIHLGF